MALLAAVASAYVFRHEWRAGNAALWILGLLAALNLLTIFIPDRFRLARWNRSASPFLALAGWGLLAHATGGVQSPFIAGLGFELILSSRTHEPLGVAGLSLAAVAVFLLQTRAAISAQFLVQSGFLGATAALAWYLTKSRSMQARAAGQQQAELIRHLDRLQFEIGDLRKLACLGEQPARLAHGMKNSVFSLRGLADLLETRMAEPERALSALNGLRRAIDHMDELARASLSGGMDTLKSVPAAHIDSDGIRRVLEDVNADISLGNPGIEWNRHCHIGDITVAVPPDVLTEVLTIVCRNAAESTQGRGVIDLTVAEDGGELTVSVRDRGPGISGSGASRIFDPCYTTKPDGHGLGLFLARRLVELRGGTLSAAPAPGGGAVFSLKFSVEECRHESAVRSSC